MIVTKNAAELCVLLIGELYGQLPARAFATLLSKGRATARELSQSTSLNIRQVRHGLVLLIQQNLVYHQTEQDTNVTHYEANPAAAYNIARIGKVLDMIHRKYGEDAVSVARLILGAGHIKVSDLVEAYKSNQTKSHNGSSHTNGQANGTTADTSNATGNAEDELEPAERVYDIVAHLIVAGILVPVYKSMFQSNEDIKAEFERELSRIYPSGARGAKQRQEYDDRLAMSLSDVHNERISLKRQLEPEYLHVLGTKRRKVANGNATNGHQSTANHDNSWLNQNIVVRLDYEKCMVELRNQKLAQWVGDEIGHITAEIYGAMLTALSKKLMRCQPDPEAPNTEYLSGDPNNGATVTTLEIFEQLPSGLDVFAGLGKSEAHDINVNSAEKIQAHPPGYDEDGAVSSDEEDEDFVMPNGFNSNGVHGSETKITAMQNGSRESKVKFEDRVHSRAERIQQMRQHLLVLAESSQQFTRHCGTRDQGEWTIDFAILVQKLKRIELDTLIESTFGRPGLRLIRILREKGKLDDKTLPLLALMKKADVHVKMTEMELAGYLDVQEVPRDTNRTASRTLFLWFFEEERTLTRVLDNTYKSMVRHLERLEVERRKKKNVLSVVERRDVQGFEEEKLRRDVYNEYQEFLDIERKLIGQINRLDDLVAVLRDF